MPWLAATLLLAGLPAQDPWGELLAPRQLAGLVQDLGSFHPLVVEVARRRLESMDAAAKPALLDALDSPDARTLGSVLELLAHCLTEDEVKRLAPLADHEHPSVRAALARIAVRTAGDDARALLRRLLAGADPLVLQVTLTEAETLPLPGRVRFAEEHLELLEFTGRGPEPRSRRATIRLLVLSDSAQAAARMVRLAGQWNREEQDLLLECLRRRPPRWPVESVRTILRSFQDRDDARIRRLHLDHVLLGVTSIDEDAFAAVVDAVLGGADPLTASMDPGEQAAALELLARLGPPAGSRLLARLPLLQDHPSFAVAVDLVMKLRGPASLDDLCTVLLTLDDRGAAEVLSLLPRLASARTAEKLESAIEPVLRPALLPALVECAMQLPDCEARRRLMLGALLDVQGEPRLRAFEGLVRQPDPAHIGFLLDALDATREPELRRRMTQMLAEAFGPLEPGEVLALLSGLLDSDQDSDRRAALSAFPFVALDQPEAIASFLVSRFEQSEPDRLLLVLSQIGGPTAEATFARLGESYAAGGDQIGLYRFLLRQAGRLSGEPSRQVLRHALQAEDTQARTIALRSLIQRRDPEVFVSACALLESLEAGDRVALLQDLAPVQSQPEMRDLLVELMPLFKDDASRIALFGLAADHHVELLREPLDRILASSTSETLRLAAIEVYGHLGGADSREVLWRIGQPVLAASAAQLVELEEEVWGRARAAALALADARAPGAEHAVAALLFRRAASDSFWSLVESVRGPGQHEASTDPLLIEALARWPADAQVEALEQARPSLGALAACLDERFWLLCADELRRNHGPESVVRWFERQPLTTPPHRTVSDASALARLSGARHGWLRTAVPVTADQLGEVPDLVAAFHDADLSPRQRAVLFGQEDPFFGWHAERLLRVLACLAEDQPDVVRLRQAAREAGHHGILLTSLARQAAAVDRALATEISGQAVTAAPYLPYALSTRIWLLPEGPEREALEQRQAEVLASGLAPPHTVTLLHRALQERQAGHDRRAADWVRDAERRDGLTDQIVRRDVAFHSLCELLDRDPAPTGRD